MKFLSTGDPMWTVARDVVEAGLRIGIEAAPLSREEADRVRRIVIAKHGRNQLGWPLWDGPNDDPSVQDEAACRWISDFVQEAPCILLWDPHDESEMLRFHSGGDLVAVLGETYRTEFYVTDEQASYLLAFNHHDCLIASGSAAEWLRQRLAR